MDTKFPTVTDELYGDIDEKDQGVLELFAVNEKEGTAREVKSKEKVQDTKYNTAH